MAQTNSIMGEGIREEKQPLGRKGIEKLMRTLMRTIEEDISEIPNEEIQRLRETIVREFLNEFFSTISPLSILKSAEEQGIVDMLLPRFTDVTRNTFKEHIEEAKGEILVIGVSGRGYLQGFGPLYDPLRKRLEEGVKVRMLLLDPLSEAMKERVEVEQGVEYSEERHLHRSELWTDLKTAAHRLVEWKAMRDFDIEGRFYSSTPTISLLKVNGFIFVEQYHLGGIKAGCIGGYVPVLKLAEGFPAYNIMMAHFEHVWDKSEKRTPVAVINEMAEKEGVEPPIPVIDLKLTSEEIKAEGRDLLAELAKESGVSAEEVKKVRSKVSELLEETNVRLDEDARRLLINTVILSMRKTDDALQSHIQTGLN